MDVVDQTFDNRFTELQAAPPGTDRFTELALDDRIDRFRFPALAEPSVQASRRYQVRPGLARWIHQFAMSADGRDQVTALDLSSIKARISQARFLAHVLPKGSAIASQAVQMSRIVTGPSPGLPSQNELGVCPNGISALYPFTIPPPLAGLVIWNPSLRDKLA